MRKLIKRVWRFFDIKLTPEEVVHLTIVQIRAM